MPGPGRPRRRTRRPRTVRSAVAAAVLVAGYLLVVAAVAGVGLRDGVARADVIVVPGNTVTPDGTPSPRLRARLDAALWLYRRGHAGLVLVSGGTGSEGVDEAAVMGDYLVAHGVPPSAVVRDGAGVDTEATARHTAAVLRERHLHRALVATQYFHVARTWLALERHGVDVVGARHARYAEWRDAYSLAREGIAFPVYLLRSG